jgi:hypothetical protein
MFQPGVLSICNVSRAAICAPLAEVEKEIIQLKELALLIIGGAAEAAMAEVQQPNGAFAALLHDDKVSLTQITVDHTLSVDALQNGFGIREQLGISCRLTRATRHTFTAKCHVTQHMQRRRLQQAHLQYARVVSTVAECR